VLALWQVQHEQRPRLLQVCFSIEFSNHRFLNLDLPISIVDPLVLLVDHRF
jgi:hypothetical protein